ncbi:hypothetical protein [Pigmentiphaga sp.]|uniref:hypothetical protein n=1 Tax=Pigmentiphaga sp. TaxID=1977564 RepID=UPI00128B97DF|nr:hypothetical protein [Pigmentiphaga sp.]MPS30088.1 hypothetical protein [Alcaligenaceae bacterium SAGV5]MPS55202.1 hypothetical protein [Alcaligenaceae bacterium SAGV3]MPT59495.1 hypothetical protein [Alcaligenaceae bacterium]
MASDRSLEKAKDALEDGLEAVDKAAHATADKVTRATRRAKDAASDALDDGSDALESALRCTQDAIRQHPVTAVALVAAVAYLLGRMRG